MQNSKLLIALAICLASSTSYAEPGVRKWLHVLPAPADIHLAQSSVDNLSQSDLKRINFYSDRVLKTIAALAAEDAVGAVDSDANVVALRAAISRLVDAGKRSGLTQTETADFFLLVAEDKFVNDVPLALQDASGKMDTRALFAGVAGRSQFGTSGKSSQNLLDHLNAESAEMAPLTDPAKLGQTSATTVSPPQELALQAPDEADSVSREVIDRIEMRNGRRFIVVASGDTLAGYAAALYGDPLAYRQIYLLNEMILASPRDLVVGTTLELP